jgi:predicted glycosyltransferase
MGPSFDDSNELSSDVILLEVGGGSAGVDLIGL